MTAQCRKGGCCPRIVVQFNVAKVFQQAWAAAKEDEAVGRRAMLSRSPRAATKQTPELAALVLLNGQALEHSFAAGRE